MMARVAFDLGGVLRKVLLPDAADRNFEALRQMYRLFCASPDWHVSIITHRPLKKLSEESVIAELKKYDLPLPDKIYVCNGSKVEHLKADNPDLLVDDSAYVIDQALELGITTLRVE